MGISLEWVKEFLNEAYGAPSWVAISFILFIGSIWLWFKYIFKHWKTKFTKISLTILFIVFLVFILFLLPFWLKNPLPPPTPEGKLGIFIAKFKNDNENQNLRIKNQLENLFSSEEKNDFYLRDLDREFADYKEAEEIGRKLKGRMIVFGDIAGGRLFPKIKILGKNEIFTEQEIPLKDLSVATISEVDGTPVDVKEIGKLLRFLYGIAMYENKNYVKAKKILSEISIENAPIKKGILYFYIGNCSLLTQSYEESLRYYDKAIEINSKLAMAWNNKGASLGKMGKFGKAIECFDKAISINPEYAVAWHNKGYAMEKIGKIDESVKCYDKTISINPESVDAWSNKGLALANIGKFDKAIECYDKAISINAEYAYAWNNKGVALGMIGRFEEAFKCFDKVISINPKFTEAWNNKGAALFKMGEFERAIECFDKAISINPKYGSAWFNKGKALQGIGKYEEAIKCYDKEISINFEDADAWCNKGYALGKLCKFEESNECFDKAISINPELAEAYAFKGAALGMMGKIVQANKALKTSLSFAQKQKNTELEKSILKNLKSLEEQGNN
ncbi:MAG: tetratricopeptide repeat protein [Chloroflexi bacterium]|nr:tetratricopeptide repeat protein [Chloroflexota bacterium]